MCLGNPCEGNLNHFSMLFQNYMRIWKDDNESCHSWIINSDFFFSNKRSWKMIWWKRIHEGLIFPTLSKKQAHLFSKYKAQNRLIITHLWWSVRQAGIKLDEAKRLLFFLRTDILTRFVTLSRTGIIMV